MLGNFQSLFGKKDESDEEESDVELFNTTEDGIYYTVARINNTYYPSFGGGIGYLKPRTADFFEATKSMRKLYSTLQDAQYAAEKERMAVDPSQLNAVTYYVLEVEVKVTARQTMHDSQLHKLAVYLDHNFSVRTANDNNRHGLGNSP